MRTHTPVGPFESLVVFGESTVEGGEWLRSNEERWADILHCLLEDAQERPLRYFNAGKGASVISPRSPGYAASNKPSASERLDEKVLAHRPDLLVIAYGLNDSRAGMAPADFREEMEKIIRRVRERCNPLIVLANVYHATAYHHFPPFDRGSVEFTCVYNALLRELARERSCAYADVWGAQGRCDHVVHQDTVHANKIGNLLIAHEVFKAIVHSAPGLADSVRARDERTDWTRRVRAAMSECVEPSGAVPLPSCALPTAASSTSPPSAPASAPSN